MVYFTCDACGASLKKNQVEKHYQFQCKSCSVLSCVDCGKDFPGDTYQEHTKCVSEEEKYSGKNFKANPSANKGERKQEAWVEQVQQAIDNVKASNHQLKMVLLKVKDYPNIPRKKNKFENFLMNSLNIRNKNLVISAWDAINTEMSLNAEKPQENSQAVPAANSIKNGQDEKPEEMVTDTEPVKLNKREKKEKRSKKKGKKEEKNKAEEENEPSRKKKKGKKRKLSEEEEMEWSQSENVSPEETPGNGVDAECSPTKKKKVESEHEEDDNEPASPVRKFSWEDTIIELLDNADDKTLAVKRLRKKVLAEYHACGGDGKTKTEAKLLARFTKKINKNPRLKVLKEKVKLVH